VMMLAFASLSAVFPDSSILPNKIITNRLIVMCFYCQLIRSSVTKGLHAALRSNWSSPIIPSLIINASMDVILFWAGVFIVFYLTVGPKVVLELCDGLGGAAGGVTAGFSGSRGIASSPRFKIPVCSLPVRGPTCSGEVQSSDKNTQSFWFKLKLIKFNFVDSVDSKSREG
jgi:hypothetical protein